MDSANSGAVNDFRAAIDVLLSNESLISALSAAARPQLPALRANQSNDFSSRSNDQRNTSVDNSPTSESIQYQRTGQSISRTSSESVTSEVADRFRPRKRDTTPLFNPRLGVGNKKRNTRRRDSSSVSQIRKYYFRKEVVLLSKANIRRKPHGRYKRKLNENGFVMSLMTFEKKWSEDEVRKEIYKAFRTKMAPHVGFDLLTACGMDLIAPTLPENESMSGELIYEIWKQKTLYLRPHFNLSQYVMEDTESSSESDFSIHRNFKQKPSPNLTNPEQSSSSSTRNVDSDISRLAQSTNRTCNIANISSPMHQSYICNISHDEIWDSDISINDSLSDESSKKDVKKMSSQLSSDNQDGNASVTLKELLQELSSRIFPFDPSVNVPIIIYRKKILDFSRRAFKRKDFDPFRKLSVKFIDKSKKNEAAVDAGGPTREFLTLLVRATTSSELFSGPETERNFNRNENSLNLDHYFDAGLAIALSIVHGGPGPSCFSQLTFNSLVKDMDTIEPKIDDVDDEELKEDLRELEKSESLIDIQTAAEKLHRSRHYAGCNGPILKVDDKTQLITSILRYTTLQNTSQCRLRFIDGLKMLDLHEKMVAHPNIFKQVFCRNDNPITIQTAAEKLHRSRHYAGCNGPILKVDDKTQLITSILRYTTLQNTSQCRLRFIDGLKMLDLHEKMVAHPNIFKQVFCRNDNPITAEKFLEMFSDVEFSENNNLSRELEVWGYFTEFVYDSYKGDTGLTLKEMLFFITGSDEVPPLGFEEKPSVIFLHENPTSKYPYANTCGLGLKLPICHQNYESFKEDISFGIKNTQGFDYA